MAVGHKPNTKMKIQILTSKLAGSDFQFGAVLYEVIHMIIGRVVGSVVSTRKSEKLIGQKFMIVEPVHHMKTDLKQIVAIDIIGAGIGEYVLVAQGSAARIGCDIEGAPVDAAIVGIVDDGAGLE